ncbi:MAG: hypothetical protein NTW11_00835 [Candidatus Staskawiczbacteria bacterium]|nr:hypothetical protein [Candidatus Staskawiczbacteria bacterium]
MRDQIIQEIIKKQDEILLKITQESVDVYLFLKNEYKKGNIKNNTLFQFVFRSFYRLDNAGLSDEIKNHYFELMAEGKNNLEDILLELYEFKNSKNQKTIQFSFATKLLHTLDNSKPIFDAEVSRVFHKSRQGKTKDEKIKSCVSIYEFLKSAYSDLLQDEKIKKIILKFRSDFNVEDKNEMSDTKVLDFIIWSLGKIKNKK